MKQTLFYHYLGNDIDATRAFITLALSTTKINFNKYLKNVAQMPSRLRFTRLQLETLL